MKDPLFLKGEFFDRRDLVQVKYEMLRRVRIDEASIVDAAAAFGLSRPSYYEALDAFTEQGLLGLRPRKRGPRGAHKLARRWSTSFESCARRSRPLRCRTRPVESRSDSRSASTLAASKGAESSGKSRRDDEFVCAEPSSSTLDALTTRYERLRAFVLGTGGDADGLVVLLRGGVVAWLQVRSRYRIRTRIEPELPRRRGRLSILGSQRSSSDLVASMISQHLSEEAA